MPATIRARKSRLAPSKRNDKLRSMRPRLLMVCLLATWIGCGKRTEPSPASAENPAATVASPAIQPPTLPSLNATALDESQTAALLKELTQAVRKFSVEQRRVPKNLEELVANSYLIGVPPAPAGKRFAIDKNLQVTLVSR